MRAQSSNYCQLNRPTAAGACSSPHQQISSAGTARALGRSQGCLHQRDLHGQQMGALRSAGQSFIAKIPSYTRDSGAQHCLKQSREGHPPFLQHPVPRWLTSGGDAELAGQRQRGDGVLVHEGGEAPCNNTELPISGAVPHRSPTHANSGSSIPRSAGEGSRVQESCLGPSW